MIDADFEIEAFGVQTTPFVVTLHVRTPTGQIHLLSMPRTLAAKLAAEVIMGLEAMPAAVIAGKAAG